MESVHGSSNVAAGYDAVPSGLFVFSREVIELEYPRVFQWVL